MSEQAYSKHMTTCLAIFARQVERRFEQVCHHAKAATAAQLVAMLRLPEQLPVHHAHARLARWLKAKLLIQRAREFGGWVVSRCWPHRIPWRYGSP